ncbi:MAG TPA: aminoacetone oxidase family FAD-binding enzyme [Thermoanaerobaculia bacterium]|nr:aminoacetone oxidase family FAD-binding enzyme [Thermoanaerobaculia bacterium]
MTVTTCDIAIAGAGAAGLTAAIFARAVAPEARIVALDGAPKIGAKILISGGGRCNVTHDVVTSVDFNGNPNAIAKVLRTFTVEETVAWFASMGVTLKREETGKLFPTTDRARTVLDALLRACEGVEVRTNARVSSCHPERESRDPGAWVAQGTCIEPPIPPGPSLTLGMTDGSRITASRVILATGGRSVPKTGSDGHGYAIARSLGHSTTEVFPALVPLIVEDRHWLTTLSGTSAYVELSVVAGKVLARQRGSMLLTHFGISGPAALDISRHWIAAPGARLVCNFLPGETFESLERAILEERNPRATIGSFLRGRLPERLIAALLEGGRLVRPLPGADGTSALHKLTKDERRRIIRSLVELPIPVVRDRGFDYAEVTAGGVPLSEIDLATMASRRCEGLFLCGEILDVDGRIGGYNFQWAWAGGRLAGIHAARSLHRLGV